MSDITMDIQYNTAWQKYTELSGQGAELLNKMANIQIYDLGRIGCAIMLACILSIAVYCIIWAICDDRGNPMSLHTKYIALAIFITMSVVLSIILVTAYHISLENQLANIEAQMDALEQVWGFDVGA